MPTTLLDQIRSWQKVLVGKNICLPSEVSLLSSGNTYTPKQLAQLKSISSAAKDQDIVTQTLPTVNATRTSNDVLKCNTSQAKSVADAGCKSSNALSSAERARKCRLKKNWLWLV